MKFTSDDIVSIIVGSEEDKEYLNKNLSNSSLIKYSSIKDKINLLKDYNETEG